MVAVQGAPSKFITGVKDPNMHFVPVDYAAPLQSDYLPSQLKAEDYPALIPPGGRVDTIAVPAILAAYNWNLGTERYRKVERFVRAFFDKFEQFQHPPFHPKWKEVAPNAPLKGWTRFPAAQQWLDQHSNQAMTDMRNKFDLFLTTRAPGDKTAEQNAVLFQQFLQWQQDNANTRAEERSHKKRSRKHHDDD